MLAIKIAALAVGLIALFMTFKAKLIIEKVFKKEPVEGLVLRVKYIALALAVIAFLTVFISGR
ncbi:MAG: hypothetical protein ACI4A5_05940 [Hominilimicola sp.]